VVMRAPAVGALLKITVAHQRPQIAPTFFGGIDLI
jgi:hypothetical protein